MSIQIHTYEAHRAAFTQDKAHQQWVTPGMKEKERETEIALKRRKGWRWGSCSKLGWGGQKQSERGEGIRRERERDI